MTGPRYGWRTLVPGAVWVHRIPLRFFGLEMGTRMTVLRLADGGLFLHSPTPADPAARAWVDALGPARFIVAPNRLHHLFVDGWASAYPDARLYGAPELMRKRPGLRWDGALGDAPEPGWAGEIDQTLFRGSVFTTEALFCHRASGTLLVADLLESAHPEDGWRERLAARLGGVYGRPGLTRDQRLLVRDRRAARRAIETVLSWAFDRIVLAHGRLVERDGRRVFAEAFRWLLG